MQIIKRDLIISIVIKSLIIIGFIIGFIDEVQSDPFMRTGAILYYTVQSNIWITAICLVFLVYDIQALRKNTQVEIPNWLRLVKYVFTVAITITFVVYNFVLYPGSVLTNAGESYLNPHTFLLHIFVPVLAILDYILYDYSLQSTKRTKYLGLITPLFYFVLTLGLSLLGVTFKKGEAMPYFFIDYKLNGWFNIGNGQIGIVYWMIIVLLVVLGICSLLLWIKNKRAKVEYAKLDNIDNNNND